MALQRTTRIARLAAGLLLLAAACAASAAGELHSLWAVKGARNTVYLFGSVHLLRSADSTLPQEAVLAYTRAKAVVLEMDVTDIPNATQALLERAALPPGQTLAGVLGPQLNAKFAATAQAMGLDPDFLNRFQPWFAMTLLEQMKMARLGYDPDVGIDRQIAKRAQSDGKPIIGLETINEQVALLADMSIADQRTFTAESLGQLDDAARMLDMTVQAWRKGDTETLQRMALDAFKSAPDVYKRLVVDRNRRWADRVAELLKERDDYFVVVGVLHLAGRDSLVDLLQKRGFTAIQQ